ncbi:Protein kinase domain-containing protein [Plasmodiophora brassicae]
MVPATSPLAASASQRVAEIRDRLRRIESSKRKAYRLQRNGNHHECVHECEKVLAANSDEPGVHATRIISQVAIGNRQAALESCQARINSADDDVLERDLLQAVLEFAGRDATPGERLSYMADVVGFVAGCDSIPDGFHLVDLDTDPRMHRFVCSTDLVLAMMKHHRVPYAIVVVIDSRIDPALRDIMERAKQAVPAGVGRDTTLRHLARFVIDLGRSACREAPAGEQDAVRAVLLGSTSPSSFTRYNAVLFKYLADALGLEGVRLVSRGRNAWNEIDNGSSATVIALESTSDTIMFDEASSHAASIRLRRSVVPRAGSPFMQDRFRDIRVRVRRCRRSLKTLATIGKKYVECYAVQRSTRQQIQKNSSNRINDLLHLQHPALLGFTDILLNDQGGWTCVSPTTPELVPLSNLVARARYRIPLCTSLRIALEIATGLQVLHDSGIIHGNLQPGSVLCDWDEVSGDVVDVRLSAYGTSNHCLDLDELTPLFARERQRSTRQGDILALATILMVLLVGDPPPTLGPGQSNYALLRSALLDRNAAYRLPDSLPSDVATLLFDCLNESESLRPAAATCARRLRQMLTRTWCRRTQSASELIHECTPT